MPTTRRRTACGAPKGFEMTMPCREFRELIDSYLAEEFLIETNHEMIRHLEGCAACRGELDGRRQLRARLQSAFINAEGLRVRPEFIRTLAAALRGPALRQSAGWARPSRWWALAAGLLIAAAIAGSGGLRRAAGERAATSRADTVDQALWTIARAGVLR